MFSLISSKSQKGGYKQIDVGLVLRTRQSEECIGEKARGIVKSLLLRRGQLAETGQYEHASGGNGNRLAE